MQLLSEDVQKQVKKALEGLESPVKMVFFTQEDGSEQDCEYCQDTRQLYQELAALSDKINLEIHDQVKEGELAEALHIDKIPAMAPMRQAEDGKDYNIRFYGIPAGYEFATLIESLLMVSRGRHDLSQATLGAIATIDRPVHIQVYVTPT